MRVKAAIRQCVTFLGRYDHINKIHAPIGTAFLVYKEAPNSTLGYLVTAKHVIQEPHSKYGIDEFFLRLNVKGANSTWEEVIGFEDWIFHTDDVTDVAVCPFSLPSKYDHLAYPIDDGGEIPDFGDEVFTVGLFWPHGGVRRASPIVRVGHISALNEEPVYVNGAGDQDAFLISSDSIGGLSGSPVFNWSNNRQVQFGPAPITGSFYLLGVNVGHFHDPDRNGKKEEAAINAGLAIVVAKKKILEVIEDTRMKAKDEIRSRLILRKDNLGTEGPAIPGLYIQHSPSDTDMSPTFNIDKVSGEFA